MSNIRIAQRKRYDKVSDDKNDRTMFLTKKPRNSKGWKRLLADGMVRGSTRTDEAIMKTYGLGRWVNHIKVRMIQHGRLKEVSKGKPRDRHNRRKWVSPRLFLNRKYSFPFAFVNAKILIDIYDKNTLPSDMKYLEAKWLECEEVTGWTVRRVEAGNEEQILELIEFLKGAIGNEE